MSDEKKLKEKVITYVQKKTKKMNIPFKLTVKGYKELYLNTQRLDDLNSEEKLILAASVEDRDPTKTPETTLAGIFRARQINKRCKTREEALNMCFKLVHDQNQEFLEERRIQYDNIAVLSQRASALNHYLNVQKEMHKYFKGQNSVFAPFINFKNKILHLFRKRPTSGQPYSDEEFNYAVQAWKEFREEQNAPETMSNAEVLKKFKYAGSRSSEPFAYTMNTELLDALQEDYAITTVALQIIDGSAVQRARKIIPYKNVFPYLKSAPEIDGKGKSLKKTRTVPKVPEEHEF